LKESRFRRDSRKKFFTVRAVRHWCRLSRGAVAAPSLAVCKVRLNGAWSTLVWRKGVPAHGRGLGTRWSIKRLPTAKILPF